MLLKVSFDSYSAHCGAKVHVKACTVKIPHRLSEAENDGIFWGASYVAQRCKNVQVSAEIALS